MIARTVKPHQAVIDQLVATHFLRNGQDGTGESDGNPDEVRADKYAVLEGAIQIIGSSLLGLTLQCAKCHDHKFEPVTQKDYYQLQAILYPAFNVEHWVKPNDRMVIAGPRAEQARWEAHDKAIDAQIDSLKRSFASGPDAAKKEKALKPVIEAVNARRRPNPGRIAWVGDVSGSPAEIPLLVRGDLATPGPEGRAGRSRLLDRRRTIAIRSPSRRLQVHPRPAVGWPWRGGSPGPARGRRLCWLACWPTGSGNTISAPAWPPRPTTSVTRALRPLIPSCSSFWPLSWRARAGAPRPCTALILTSSVFRQSSSRVPQAARLDPDNRLLGAVSSPAARCRGDPRRHARRLRRAG